MAIRGSARACAAAGLVLLLAAGVRAETIAIHFETPQSEYRAGDAIDVSVFAEAPSTLVGFGFDLLADGDALSYDGFDVAGPFAGVFAPDGDTLAGLFLSGGDQEPATLLGTAHYRAELPGQVSLDLTTTPGDLTEGFARFGRGFFDISTEPLRLSILGDNVPAGSDFGGTQPGGGPPVPEPTTALLLARARALSC